MCVCALCVAPRTGFAVARLESTSPIGIAAARLASRVSAAASLRDCNNTLRNGSRARRCIRKVIRTRAHRVAMSYVVHIVVSVAICIGTLVASNSVSEWTPSIADITSEMDSHAANHQQVNNGGRSFVEERPYQSGAHKHLINVPRAIFNSGSDLFAPPRPPLSTPRGIYIVNGNGRKSI